MVIDRRLIDPVIISEAWLRLPSTRVKSAWRQIGDNVETDDDHRPKLTRSNYRNTTCSWNWDMEGASYPVARERSSGAKLAA